MSTLEKFARQYELGKIDTDEFGQRAVLVEGTAIVEAGGRLLLCPGKYPQNWPQLRRRLVRAGFVAWTQDCESEEWAFNPGNAVQVRMLFTVLGELAVQEGDNQPEPRYRREQALRRAQAERDPLRGVELRLSRAAQQCATQMGL